MGAPVGNTNGAKAKRWQKAIERALARAGGDIDAGLAPIADSVVAAARSGDKDAWREIGDRLDGKPAQTIQGDDNAPIVFRIDAPWMVPTVAARNE
jgi:hypothetical protein